jgi:uncharacterized membrane protein (UPF0182 family)
VGWTDVWIVVVVVVVVIFVVVVVVVVVAEVVGALVVGLSSSNSTNDNNDKAKLPLCLIKYHVMKACGGSRGIASYILNLGVRCK